MNQERRPVNSSMLFALDYIYKTAVALPQDLLSEFHLRGNRRRQNLHKKMLGYWDFNQRLAKTGDFIVFLEVLNVLRSKFKLNHVLKNIDLCFIDDPSHYNSKFAPYQKSYSFKKDIKALSSLNPHIDSVFMFSSNKEFEAFYQQNRERYIRWPPTVSGSIPSDCRIVEKHFAEQESIPLLSLPSSIMETVESFYEKEVYPAKPVVINIRNNPSHDTFRNSNLPEVKKFLQKYRGNQKYKFIFVCKKEEVPANFREHSNVLFSKDYFEGIEYDIALIKASYLSIFPDSGMVVFACFSNVPFLWYGGGIPSKVLHRHMRPLDGRKFNFLTEYQQCNYYKESEQLLGDEFESLASSLEERERIRWT